MNELKHILPGEPIPRGSLFHERRYRVAKELTGNFAGAGRLLDIGSGNAGQTEFFAQHMKQAIGLDLQISRLPGFSQELARRNITNLTLIGGNAEQLPFKDQTFEYVACFEMLEHVRDQNQTLAEIKRVLKPDGALIMSLPHRWWIFETHGADLPLLPWNRIPFFSWLPKRLHDRRARARIYTRKEARILLEQAGFTHLQILLLTAPMDVVKNKAIQNILRHAIFTGDTTRIPFLASNIFIFARNSS